MPNGAADSTQRAEGIAMLISLDGGHNLSNNTIGAKSSDLQCCRWQSLSATVSCIVSEVVMDCMIEER